MNAVAVLEWRSTVDREQDHDSEENSKNGRTNSTASIAFGQVLELDNLRLFLWLARLHFSLRIHGDALAGAYAQRHWRA